MITIRLRKLSDTVTPQLKNMMIAFGKPGQGKVLQMAATKFKAMAQSTFGQGRTTYRGNTWKPYSRSYAKQIGSRVPTLYRTGKLKASIKVTAPRGNWIGVYADARQAAAQFLGSKKNNLPARRFFPLEGNGTSWRLSAKAEKDLVIEVGRGFSIMSGGALPRITGISERSSLSYGNPLQAAS